MTRMRAILIAAAALAATAALDAAPPAAGEYIAYVGPYTRPNKSKGIYAYRFDAKTGKFTSIGLAAETNSPSFVVIHPNGKFLYAVNESRENTTSAFAIDPATHLLKFLNSVATKGGGPCHLALDRTGKLLFVAYYNSGSVAAFPVKEDGSLGEASAFIQHSGSSVNRGRQSGPHAHEAVVSRDNRFLFVPDLGMDKVMIYKIDAAKGSLTPNDPPFATITPGSGPRHMAFDAKDKFAYVISEMTSAVTAYAFDAKTGALKQLETYPALPADYTGQKSGAEIAIHPNGKFLYASNRSHNSITAFAVDGKGGLKNIGNFPVAGKTPRHFAIDPTGSYMVVENQDSDNMVVFKIDAKTGKLTPTGDSIEIGAPVSLAFMPAK